MCTHHLSYIYMSTVGDHTTAPRYTGVIPATCGWGLFSLVLAWVTWGGGYLSAQITQSGATSNFLKHLLTVNIIIIQSSQHTSRLQVTGTTHRHLCIKKTIIIVSIDGYISITSFMFNIIADITIPLCLLTSHVTTTCVNATNTGWLPPHNATAK